MSPENTVPEPFFIAYFDEAGDPGLKTVAPVDENGASEWFSVGCALIRADKEETLVPMVREIKESIYSTQSPDLHFRNLREHKKLPVCQALAEKDMRYFAVVSHKHNMRGYRNPNAEAVSLHPNNWFYNFCIRVLLERMTEWCADWSLKNLGETRRVKLVFSERGGHSYRHVETYIHLLTKQIQSGELFLSARAPDARVIDHRLIDVIPHNKSAGCQVADVVASSFFQAANVGPKKWTTENAEALSPRVPRKNGSAANFGATLLPWRNWELRLTDEQKKIFRFYGYKI